MAQAKEKEISMKNTEAQHGGQSGDGSGPTSSSRSYPKSGRLPTSAEFNPMADKKRGATDWNVGGV